ncbi:MAG: cupin domain-containing protein [Rhodobacterales bacterium]|nr:cupin domain-containing protein [Rhodobacterales bacterium]
MQQTTRVIRLDANGPKDEGLQPLTLDPADFQSPLPVQHVHEYFGDEEAGLSVGVWDTTSMQEAFGPYPGDEFILVLEGAFAMVDGKGGAVTARAGDSVTFRNGIPTSWKQDGYLKKIYLTWRAPGVPPPAIDSAEGGVTVLATPLQAGEVVFRNDTGNMTVRHFAADTLGEPFSATDAHELVQVLQGEVQITEHLGATQTFGAGEVAFIPRGTICAWAARLGFSAWRIRLELPVAKPSDRS